MSSVARDLLALLEKTHDSYCDKWTNYRQRRQSEEHDPDYEEWEDENGVLQGRDIPDPLADGVSGQVLRDEMWKTKANREALQKPPAIDSGVAENSIFTVVVPTEFRYSKEAPNVVPTFVDEEQCLHDKLVSAGGSFTAIVCHVGLPDQKSGPIECLMKDARNGHSNGWFNMIVPANAIGKVGGEDEDEHLNNHDIRPGFIVKVERFCSFPKLSASSQPIVSSVVCLKYHIMNKGTAKSFDDNSFDGKGKYELHRFSGQFINYVRSCGELITTIVGGRSATLKECKTVGDFFAEGKPGHSPGKTVALLTPALNDKLDGRIYRTCQRCYNMQEEALEEHVASCDCFGATGSLGCIGDHIPPGLLMELNQDGNTLPIEAIVNVEDYISVVNWHKFAIPELGEGHFPECLKKKIEEIIET